MRHHSGHDLGMARKISSIHQQAKIMRRTVHQTRSAERDITCSGSPFWHMAAIPICSSVSRHGDAMRSRMLTFLLWLLLLIFCWPLALLALVLYPIIWLLLLPFRLLGVAVEGVFEFLRAILMLPARVLRGRP